MRHEESGAQLDQGTDAAQVRRSAPAEPTRTENALRVRCSRGKRRVKMQNWACVGGVIGWRCTASWLQMVTVLTNSVPNSLIMIPSPVPFQSNMLIIDLSPKHFLLRSCVSIQINNSGGQERGQSQTVGRAVTAAITG